MTVNVIGQRMNFMVILHGCWLVVILTRRRRAAIARLWPKYCLFLVVFLIYQYLLCVGMPPALCVGKGAWGGPPPLQGDAGLCVGRLPALGKGAGGQRRACPPVPPDYPWRWSRALPVNSALIKWLYLPDFFVAPKSTNLISEYPHHTGSPPPTGHPRPWYPPARRVSCTPAPGTPPAHGLSKSWQPPAHEAAQSLEAPLAHRVPCTLAAPCLWVIQPLAAPCPWLPKSW